MKFHVSTTTGNTVTAFGPGWVRVGTTEYRGNLVVTPEAVATDWAPGGFEGLTEHDFARLLDISAPGCAAAQPGLRHQPDVVLLGTGAALRFPPPRLARALVEARVGLEVMDTAAACRTFNILAAEGRKVVAALIV